MANIDKIEKFEKELERLKDVISAATRVMTLGIDVVDEYRRLERDVVVLTDAVLEKRATGFIADVAVDDGSRYN